MSHVVSQPNLVSALETCAPICGGKHITPAYNRVVFSLSHKLAFHATNGAVSLTGDRPLEKSGALKERAVNCGDLLEAARRMPGDINVAVREGEIELKAGRRTYKIATLEADDIHRIERPERPFDRAKAAPILAAIQRVQWASSIDPERPGYLALLVHGGKVRTRAVHMSGHKAAEFTGECDGSVKALIPLSMLQALTAAAESSEEIGFHDDGAALWLDTDAGLFRYLSAVERMFPDHIFDGAFDAGDRPLGFDAETKDLAEAVKFASVASRDGAIRRVRVSSADGNLTVSAASTESQRESMERITVDEIGPCDFYAEPAYLLEALAHCDARSSWRQSSRVGALSKNGHNTNPVIITSGSLRACVMPQFA